VKAIKDMNIGELERWSEAENQSEKFSRIRTKLVLAIRRNKLL